MGFGTYFNNRGDRDVDIRTARQNRLLGADCWFCVGGAAGNWIDRVFKAPEFFNGHVVDFIQIPFNFPIFNLADSFLVVGVILVVIQTMRGDEIGGGRAA